MVMNLLKLISPVIVNIYYISLFIYCLSDYNHDENNPKNSPRTYLNHFAVRLAPGANPNEVANVSGYSNLGRIGTLENYYLFIGHHLHKRSTDRHHAHTLDSHEHVLWFQQQHEKIRTKRDMGSSVQPTSPAQTLSSVLKFTDPLYDKQWYFHGGARGGFDMNVKAVWKMGYTGKNVVLTILDDGVQADHPDLIKNYDHLASYDINDRDDDPTPQNNAENKHGTRCAGEISAEAGNEFCGVGVAYNSSIGGVRMLDGTVTDEVEATALSLRPEHIDVYSASWGPDDNGKTVDGPGHLAAQAFINGVKNGRKGRGSIFVWASGNGGRKSDNCNCDGYTNSIYTLSISSATQRGQKPWYLEECSSTLATTYSSGTPAKDDNIVTVDQNVDFVAAIKKGQGADPSKLCTQVHTGTSASAPIAAGIVALALEANPNLTWRDMQHLVVQTSRYDPLKHESGWVTNAVGRKVSHKFGYGLMDAEAMVKLALRWKTSPPQVICKTPPDNKERLIQDRLTVTMNTNACAGTDNAVRYLEHVQARISLKFHLRGNLRITLISPSNTPTHLLLPRPRDTDEDTFDKWPFMSVHFWGEQPQGTWKLIIENANKRRIADQQGHLFSWSLVFYGTSTPPQDDVVSLHNLTSAPKVAIGGHNLPRRTYDQASFNSHDPQENLLSLDASSSKLQAINDEKIKGDPFEQFKKTSFAAPPAWMVPIAIVLSIFVITILVLATVFTLFKVGSKIVSRIELRQRYRSGVSRQQQSSSAINYSRLLNDSTSEC